MQPAVVAQTGHVPSQASSTREPMNSSSVLEQPRSASTPTASATERRTVRRAGRRCGTLARESTMNRVESFAKGDETMKRILLACCVVVATFASCEPVGQVCDPKYIAEKPQVCPDRTSTGFGREFGTATYIGTKPVTSFILRNGGDGDLVIKAIETTGDSQFKYTASWDTELDDGAIPGTTVKGNKKVLIQVEFAPTQAKAYAGTIVIESNAQNTPNLTLQVSGCGLPADGGTSPCYADGGTL